MAQKNKTSLISITNRSKQSPLKQRRINTRIIFKFEADNLPPSKSPFQFKISNPRSRPPSIPPSLPSQLSKSANPATPKRLNASVDRSAPQKSPRHSSPSIRVPVAIVNGKHRKPCIYGRAVYFAVCKISA